MFKCCEDPIKSSPEPKKRVSDSILHRQSKRKRNNADTSGSISPELFISLPNDSSICLSLEQTSVVDDNSLYWFDADDGNVEVMLTQPADVYAEDLALERANRGSTVKCNFVKTHSNHEDEEFITLTGTGAILKNEDFQPQTQEYLVKIVSGSSNICDIKPVNVDSNAQILISRNRSPADEPHMNMSIAISGAETQFGISESQLSIFCNDVEKKEIEKTATKSMEILIQPPNSNIPIVNAICNDFTELEDEHFVSELLLNKTRKWENSIPKFRFRNKTIRTYAAKKRTNNQTLNLEPIYESDSNSSISSQFSIKNDIVIVSLPPMKQKLDDELHPDANKDLLNLSSFFLDSFCMKKCKKWIEKDENWMLNYFKNRQNFMYDMSADSDEEFHGFLESDNEDSVNENIASSCCTIKTIVSQNEQKSAQTANYSESEKFEEDIFSDGDAEETFMNIDAQILAAYKQEELSKSKESTDEPQTKNVNNDENVITESDIWLDEDMLQGINTQSFQIGTTDLKKNPDNPNIKSNKFDDQKFAEIPTVLLSTNENCTNQKCEGFKYASKKPIAISKKALEQAEAFMKQFMNEDLSLVEDKENISLISNKKSPEQVKNQNNDQIDINELLNDSLLDEIDFDEECKQLEPILSENCKLDPLQKAANFLNGITAEITTSTNPHRITTNITCGTNPPNSFKGNISKISATNSPNNLNETKPQNFLNGITSETTGTDPPCMGFKTGSGKSIKVSAEAMLKAQKFLRQTNQSISTELDSGTILTQFPMLQNLQNEQKPNSTNELNGDIANIPLTVNRIEQNKMDSISPIQSNRVTRSRKSRLSKDKIQPAESLPVKVLRSTLKKKIKNSIPTIKNDNENSMSSENLTPPSTTIPEYNIREYPQTQTPLSIANNSTPLSHRSLSQRNSFKHQISGTNLTGRKNILSLSRRKFKPPTIIVTPSKDEKFSTPNRQQQRPEKTLLQTPNLQEFFDSVPIAGDTSTPILITAQCSANTNVASPLTTIIQRQGGTNASRETLMTSEMKNSSITDDMNLIKWDESIIGSQSLNNLPGTNRINVLNRSVTEPSSKDRIGRLKIQKRPPNLSPIAFIDTCRPSGLRRTSAMIKNRSENRLFNDNPDN